MSKLDKLEHVVSKLSTLILGKDEKIKLILAAILSGGHVLIEDIPGVGKTTLSKSIAKVLGLSFSRIQGSPDLMPLDILGFQYFRFKEDKFEFIKGPLFSNLVLFDELNRTAPKTQSALLEVMQEKQITLEGRTFKLQEPFIVLATQNPYEFYGTYPLPVSQLDRFFIRIDLSYPDREFELKMLKLYKQKDFKALIKDIEPILSIEDIFSIKEEILSVTVKDEVLEYILDIAKQTREDENLLIGLSPRALLDLQKASQVWAYLSKRDYVIPDDVKFMLKYVVLHRLPFKEELTFKEKELVLQNILEKVSVVKV